MMDILENTHCWFKLELSRLFLYRPDTNFGIREPRSLGCTDPTPLQCQSSQTARKLIGMLHSNKTLFTDTEIWISSIFTFHETILFFL